MKKKGKDKRYIKNWRPIFLLNVDAKIISKVMANCLKKVIGTLFPVTKQPMYLADLLVSP